MLGTPKTTPVPRHSSPLVTRARSRRSDERKTQTQRLPRPPQANNYPSPQTCYPPTAPRARQQQGMLRTLICEYIDHLIEENEQLTQISRAYSVPTPLDFENEHYFEEIRNTNHPFPSERFRAWLEMKEYENCLNINQYCELAANDLQSTPSSVQLSTSTGAQSPQAGTSAIEPPAATPEVSDSVKTSIKLETEYAPDAV